METIRTSVELKSTIQQLENEKALKLILLKEQVHIVCEKLKPGNLIKNTIMDIASDTGLKNTITDDMLGYTIGAASKKVLIGKTKNPFVKLIGFTIERVVSNQVIKNATVLKSFAGAVWDKIIKSREEPKTQ
jgi:hypothetical protein